MTKNRKKPKKTDLFLNIFFWQFYKVVCKRKFSKIAPKRGFSKFFGNFLKQKIPKIFDSALEIDSRASPLSAKNSDLAAQEYGRRRNCKKVWAPEIGLEREIQRFRGPKITHLPHQNEFFRNFFFYFFHFFFYFFPFPLRARIRFVITHPRTYRHIEIFFSVLLYLGA